MKHVLNIALLTAALLMAWIVLHDFNNYELNAGIVSEVQYENSLHDSFDNLQAVIHEVKGSAENLGNKRMVDRTFTTYHIGSGYLVTCAHCTDYAKIVPIRGPYGIYYATVDWGAPSYTSEGTSIKFIGSYSDVAVLHNPELIGTAFIPFGDSSKLRVGDTVTDIGNSFMKGINIKTGMVSKINIDKPVLTLPEHTKNKTIVITTPTIGGDSGSPLLAFNLNTRQYEIIGMVFAGTNYTEGYNFALKSNYVQTIVREILGLRQNVYMYRYPKYK